MMDLFSGQLKLYSDITETSVDWLWYPYIPFGKLTLIQGDPGCGKSTLMMPVLNVSLILCFDRLTIEDGVKLSFHFLKTVMSLAVIHAGSETLEAVPVDVLSFPGSIDVISFGEIKLTIIVLGIVDTMLSGPAVVPCHFHFSLSPPTIEKRAAKRANPAF